jgi:glyoxylase I family protein
MSQITNIHHLAVTVSDVDASAAFYKDLLDLGVAFEIHDDTVRATIFAGDGFLFGIRQYLQHDADRFSEFRTGMDHFAFGVPDRDALAHFEQRLTDLQATFTPTTETPIGPVLVFRDPDGIQGEFFLSN